MNTRWRLLLVLILASACSGFLSCAKMGSKSVVADAQSVGDAYVAAIEANDAEAAAAFWTEDGQHTDMETGDTISGRQAILAALTEALKSGAEVEEDPGTFTAEAISNMVVMEKGRTWVTDEDGKTQAVKSVTIYVKRGGDWKIHRVWSAPDPVHSNYEHLKPLSWMIGEWTKSEDGKDTYNVYRWTKNRNFIARTFKVSEPSGDLVTGGELIGWDPAAEAIRSWTYDSTGGFAVAQWGEVEGTLQPQIILNIEPAEPAERQAALDKISWLIGKWTARIDDDVIAYECRWIADKAFLALKWESTTDRIAGQDGLIVVGWDETEQTLKTWTFDTDGGFAEGLFKKPGDKWQLVNTHVLPDGSLGSSVTVFNKVDDNTITWRRVAQEIDGELMPDGPENTLVRVIAEQ